MVRRSPEVDTFHENAFFNLPAYSLLAVSRLFGETLDSNVSHGDEINPSRMIIKRVLINIPGHRERLKNLANTVRLDRTATSLVKHDYRPGKVVDRSEQFAYSSIR